MQKEGIKKQIPFPISFCTVQFLHISQGVIQNQNKNSLILTAVQVLHVETIKIHKIQYKTILIITTNTKHMTAVKISDRHMRFADIFLSTRMINVLKII